MELGCYNYLPHLTVTPFPSENSTGAQSLDATCYDRCKHFHVPERTPVAQIHVNMHIYIVSFGLGGIEMATYMALSDYFTQCALDFDHNNSQF